MATPTEVLPSIISKISSDAAPAPVIETTGFDELKPEIGDVIVREGVPTGPGTPEANPRYTPPGRGFGTVARSPPVPNDTYLPVASTEAKSLALPKGLPVESAETRCSPLLQGLGTGTLLLVQVS
jgi:hypothetical protein